MCTQEAASAQLQRLTKTYLQGITYRTIQAWQHRQQQHSVTYQAATAAGAPAKTAAAVLAEAVMIAGAEVLLDAVTTTAASLPKQRYHSSSGDMHQT